MSGKFKNDESNESLTELKIFYPLSDKLIPFFHKLNFTPNMITILSLIFSLLSIYFLFEDKKIFFVLFYLIGFLFDCMDGRMARKYNQGSIYGMMLDMVCDISKVILLILVIIYKLLKKKEFFKLILFLVLFVIINFFAVTVIAMNDAILSYEKYNNDNFYLNKKKEIINSNLYNKNISKIYLLFFKNNYKNYRTIFPNELNQKNIENFEKTIYKYKEFGGGNTIFLICFLIFFI